MPARWVADKKRRMRRAYLKQSKSTGVNRLSFDPEALSGAGQQHRKNFHIPVPRTQDVKKARYTEEDKLDTGRLFKDEVKKIFTKGSNKIDEFHFIVLSKEPLDKLWFYAKEFYFTRDTEFYFYKSRIYNDREYALLLYSVDRLTWIEHTRKDNGN